MAIKGNVGSGPIDVLTSDTVIYSPGGIDRYHVTALNIHNTSASTAIEFFISPNATSASGDRVDFTSIGENLELDINAIVGQGYANLYIIAKAAAAGVKASITVTQYTEGD